MNDILNNYNIYICAQNELSDLQNFINIYWKKNHILVSSRELIDWQHLEKESKTYNFVIARSKQTNEIDGILGFIPTSHFDKYIENNDIILALWKIKDGIKVTGLGMALLLFLEDTQKPRSISGCGFPKYLIPVYKLFGYKIEQLNHYYLANNKKAAITRLSLLQIGLYLPYTWQEPILLWCNGLLGLYPQSSLCSNALLHPVLLAELQGLGLHHTDKHHAHLCDQEQPYFQASLS